MPRQQIDASSARHCYDAHVNDAALAARRAEVKKRLPPTDGIWVAEEAPWKSRPYKYPSE
jgi:hypothetical protein